MEEGESIVSHELLAHELLGGGAVIKEGELDKNAKGPSLPTNIRWMIFKVKQRAKTRYRDKVADSAGLSTPSNQLSRIQNENTEIGNITYNWPYDFFSLVELVKLDAEVTFANIVNDDKGNKTLSPITKKTVTEESPDLDKSNQVAIGRGKKE